MLYVHVAVQEQKSHLLIAEDAVLAPCPMRTDSGGRGVPPAARDWKQLDFSVKHVCACVSSHTHFDF